MLRSPRETSWRASSTTSALLVVWALIGLGASADLGRYSFEAVLLVVVGTAVLVTVALREGGSPLGWSRITGVLMGVVVMGAFENPAGLYGSGAALSASRVLTSVAAIVVALWAVLDLRRPQAFAYAAVALMVVAGVAMVRSSPKPPIDVWYMLQAAGHALSHDRNIYTTRWTTGIGYEQSNGFAYLPGAALLLWPFHALFGDVRYGLLAAMAMSALLMIRTRAGSAAALLGTMVLVYPKALFGLEQSWVDPLVLAALCAAVYATTRGRHGWAVVAFGVCLVCKQQAWLVLPLAFFWKDFGWRRAATSAVGALVVMLPWVASNPHAFYSGAVAYNLDLPPRMDSLSLYPAALSVGWHPEFVLTAAITLGALVVVIWRVPRTTFGFLLGSAAVMAVFNLTNKQSFFNEWALTAGLVLAAIAFGGPRPAGEPFGGVEAHDVSHAGAATGAP